MREAQKQFIQRLALGVAISAIPVTIASGQTRAVVWSSDPSCGFHTANFDPSEKLVCSMVDTPRGPVNAITTGGITLAVVFAEDGDHILVAANITNATGEVISFDSDLWGAAHFKTREDFTNKQPPLLAETSIPSRDLIRAMASGKQLEDSLGEFMSETAMTAEDKEMKRADGTRYKVTVIVPDKDVKDAEQGKSANRSENLTLEQTKIRQTALTAKSVQPGGSIKGLVYFRRVKKAGFVVFSFSIENTVYIFRLPRQPS